MDYELVRIKSDWCPEWLWRVLKVILPLWALKYGFTRKATREEIEWAHLDERN